MATYLKLQYAVVFGKLDSSDWIDWEVELTPSEETSYLKAIQEGKPLNEVEELKSAVQRAYDDIEEEKIQMGLDNQEEYVQQCQGVCEVDPDEINELVEQRDPHTLEYFELTDLSDEDLEDWDANDLDELPLIEDFVEDFEPHSPFEEGWTLLVQIVDENE